MSILGSVANVATGAINGIAGGGAAGGNGAAGGAGGDAANFQSQIAELKRVSEEAQAKSIQMRMVSTQLSSDKKVADERVQ
ncbi:hypothetical protein [Terrihabitans sp. B22-R8]|uniref:hypothetical protein n=1 Tax=Terrihabitans sp. B22-R8 TaxID=3425128 RepID=UPI00403CF167